jgi:hypothetical protein
MSDAPELEPAPILAPALRRGALMCPVFALVCLAANVGPNKGMQNAFGIITTAIGGCALGLGYAPVSVIEGLAARKPTIPRLVLAGVASLALALVIVLFAGLQGRYSAGYAEFHTMDGAWWRLQKTLETWRVRPLWPLSYVHMMLPIAFVIPLRARKVRLRWELPIAVLCSEVAVVPVWFAFRAGGEFEGFELWMITWNTFVTTLFLVLAFRLSDWFEKKIEARLAARG